MLGAATGARQHGQGSHRQLAMPDLQRFGTAGLDGGRPVISHLAQHLDESVRVHV
jgi:hypothetical protein